MQDFHPHPRPEDCQERLHPMAVRGFRLFNAHRFWEAHEALERAWLEERGQIRHLYRGILQVGVVYYHIQRGNFAGAVKVHDRCRRWIDPFPSVCRKIDVDSIRRELANVMGEVYRLGPDRINEFDSSLFKPLQWEE